ncbi:MAG TPA: hypothetical protein VHR66_10875 [Gemmataceae bacterium]|jgi:hypothetical protein|nr:hypothetical protein [Gemmataceae bacterium]
MSIQINDETTATNLGSASSPQEVHGPDGRLLGQFIPAPRPGLSYPEVGLTDAELLARLNNPAAKWRTPEEVMARLREIDQCSP